MAPIRGACPDERPGVATPHPPQSGRVVEVIARENQEVAAGTPLLIALDAGQPTPRIGQRVRVTIHERDRAGAMGGVEATGQPIRRRPRPADAPSPSPPVESPAKLGDDLGVISGDVAVSPGSASRS